MNLREMYRDGYKSCYFVNGAAYKDGSDQIPRKVIT